MTRKVTTAKPDETHETITVSQEGEPDASISIDITTPEGAIILQLLEQLDASRADEPATFTVRSGIGRDLTVALPARPPGATELVLGGRLEIDGVGLWDAQIPSYSFAWENPAARPVPPPLCGVTGNPCANLVAGGIRYCTECPGMTVRRLIDCGVAYPPGTLDELARSEAE